MIYYQVIDSPIGKLTLGATKKGLCSLKFGEVKTTTSAALNDAPKDAEQNAAQILQEATSQLSEYFAGKRKDFDLPFDIQTGTEFQKDVWEALQTIPYGTTCSYKDVAKKIGREKACRAVGGANNKNPIAIIIPCHRVVGSSGKLVGFAGGLDIKKALLELEQGCKI